MPWGGWQPCNNMDNQNVDKATNSAPAWGGAERKETPGTRRRKSWQGNLSPRPLPCPGLERFHLCFGFKRRIFIELGKTRESMDKMAPVDPSSLRREGFQQWPQSFCPCLWLLTSQTSAGGSLAMEMPENVP